ncbi:MAG: DUF4199 domain-containing protein [Bacteroidaceae bacterium]
MNRQETFNQTNAFAMQYGMAFGAIWAISFFSFIFHFQFPFLMLVFLFTTVSAPFIGIKFTKMFRKQTSVDDTLSFRKAYIFSLLTYLYSSILLALLAYLYFEFLDGGMFCDNYEAFLAQPDVKEQLSTPEMQRTFELMAGSTDIKIMVDLIRNTSSITKAASCLDTSIFFGFVLSIPTALLCKRNTPQSTIQ